VVYEPNKPKEAIKTLKDIKSATDEEIDFYLSSVSIAELRAHVKEISDVESELRDKFAAAALQGMLADPNFNKHPDEASRLCYRAADAMLAARKENP
jgi:hypothetical protein